MDEESVGTMDEQVATLVGGATLAHEMPGRIRLRVHSARGDADRAAEIEEVLATDDLFEFVAANPTTGSVVVEYDPDRVERAYVLARIARLLDVEIHEAPSPGGRDAQLDVRADRLAAGVRQLASKANDRVATATGGVDLRILVPGALFFLGVGSFLGARRRRMPSWDTLIWYAFNTFEFLNRTTEEAGQAAGEQILRTRNATGSSE